MPKTSEPVTTPEGRDQAQDLRLLEVFSAIGTSLDVERTADHLLAGLRTLFAFDSASIFVRERGRRGHIICQRTQGNDGARRKRSRPEMGRGIVGSALSSGKAALHTTIEDETRSDDLRETTASTMIAPIIGGEGRYLGAILLEADAPERFGDASLETLMSYARAAAGYVERALLHARLLSERRLEGEIDVARQVMEGLLPGAAPKLEGFDMVARIEPCYEVGGDFFDFIPLGNDRWGIAMADVSGKGVPAALVVAAMRAALYTLAKRELALRSVLRYANEFIHLSTGPKSKYVTLFYAVLDTQARRFIYINAGHLPPIVLRTNDDIELLHSGGFPLGFFDNPRYFEQFVQLKAGDLLCLYTDGITEAANVKDEEYGRARLIEALRRSRGGTAAEICDAVSNDVRHFSERAPADDATVLVIKAT